MTTFAPIATSSATLNASMSLKFAPLGRATLPAKLTASPDASKLRVGGTVLERDLQATLNGVSTLVLNPTVRRAASATLRASLTKVDPQGGVAIFSPMAGLAANKFYAAGRADIGPFTGLATDPLPVPSFALAVANFEPMVGVAAGITGEIATATASFGFASLATNKPYAGSNPVTPLLGIYLWGYADQGEGNTAFTGTQYLSAYGWFDPDVVMLAEAPATIEATDTFEPVRLSEEAMIDLIMASGTAQSSLLLYGTFQEVLYVMGVIGRRDPMAVWAVNVKNKATSAYENFEFNSFASFNGRYFLANDNGLFEIAGDTDAGTPIIAKIMTPKQDFETSAKKRVFAVYAGMDSVDDMELTVFTDDGQRNEYVLTATSGLQSTRTLIGRGLYSRYWQFMVSNPDGEMFEIESLEVLPALASRRV